MAVPRRRTARTLLAACALSISAALGAAAQETKPVPKDSARVVVRGCTKGYLFTAAPRVAEEPGTMSIPEGMHLRMNGPKAVMADIKKHEGGMIEITGLMKRGQYLDGVSVGKGVRISPGAGGFSNPSAGQPQIDLESWRPVDGGCRTK